MKTFAIPAAGTAAFWLPVYALVLSATPRMGPFQLDIGCSLPVEPIRFEVEYAKGKDSESSARARLP